MKNKYKFIRKFNPALNKRIKNTTDLNKLINSENGYELINISSYLKKIRRISDNYIIEYYPTSSRYHDIETGKRGSIKVEDLLSLFN